RCASKETTKLCRPTHHFVGLTSPPSRSSRSDGLTQSLSRCPHESIRRTRRGCANADRPGIAACRQTPDAFPRHSGGRCASTVVRVRLPHARAWLDCPILSDTQPYIGRPD